MDLQGHWPWLTVDSWSEDRPKDWSKLFGKRGAQFTQIAYEDIPELQEFRAYCETRTDLRGTLLQPANVDLDFLQTMFIDHLSLDVYERAMHLGAHSLDSILPIYLEAERSVLQETLTGDIIVPLAFAAFAPNDLIHLDSTTTVRPLSVDEQRARAITDFNAPVTARVINSATHAIVLQDVIVDNLDPWSRVLGRFRGESVVPYEQIDIAVRAIRILVPEPFGYTQVLLSPHNWSDRWKLDLPAMQTMATVRKYPPSLDDKNYRDPVTIIPPEITQNLPEAHAALLRGDGRLNLAARRLDIARYRLDTDDTIIDCAVGLEALLGGDRTELAHRIATRAAVLLRSKFQAEMVYQSVRKIYDRRSEIVHGSQRSKSARITFGDATFSTHTIALWILREVVASAVADRLPIDRQALDAMALDAIQQTAPSASVKPPAEEGND
jgi:hypothetical protein